MAIRLVIENVKVVGEGVWSVSLPPAEIAMIADSNSVGIGEVSIFGVLNPQYDAASKTLSIDYKQMHAFNIGKTDRALIIDIGALPMKADSNLPSDQLHSAKNNPSLGYGDSMFLAACRRELSPHLVKMAENLLSQIRRRYQGELREGKARKWVNSPKNFVAITIQNRDQSLAIYVKGDPQDFQCKTIEIKKDRPGYSRFKLKEESQMPEALSVIIESAKKDYGY